MPNSPPPPLRLERVTGPFKEEHRRTRRTKLNLQIKSTSSKLNGFKQESDQRSTAVRANGSRNKIQKPQVTILDLEENRNPSMKNNMGKNTNSGQIREGLEGDHSKNIHKDPSNKSS